MKGTFIASGSWQVQQGRADEFVGRWEELLLWTGENHPDLEFARLVRSESDDHSFLSFSVWPTVEARDAWKSSDGFSERFEACRELCADFRGSDFQTVAAI